LRNGRVPLLQRNSVALRLMELSLHPIDALAKALIRVIARRLLPQDVHARTQPIERCLTLRLRRVNRCDKLAELTVALRQLSALTLKLAHAGSQAIATRRA